MSTTHCGTNIVRIRVGLFNDILRFDYALCIFFNFLNLLLRFNCSVTPTLSPKSYEHTDVSEFLRGGRMHNCG